MEIALAIMQTALLVLILILLWHGSAPQPQTTASKRSGLFQKLTERIAPRPQTASPSASYRNRMSPQEFADHAERRYLEIRQKEENEKEKAHA